MSTTKYSSSVYIVLLPIEDEEAEEFVIPEDVKKVAPYVLAHRISKESGKMSAALKFLNKIIENVEVPLETV